MSQKAMVFVLPSGFISALLPKIDKAYSSLENETGLSSVTVTFMHPEIDHVFVCIRVSSIRTK